MAFATSWLSLSRRLFRDAPHRSASAASEPALIAAGSRSYEPKKKAEPHRGPALFVLVAGARLLENVHLYAEPFPLVT